MASSQPLADTNDGTEGDDDEDGSMITATVPMIHEFPPEPVTSRFVAAAAATASGRRKRKHGAPLESAGDTGSVRRKKIVDGEMMSAARRVYGRHFNIATSHAGPIALPSHGSPVAPDDESHSALVRRDGTRATVIDSTRKPVTLLPVDLAAAQGTTTPNHGS